MRGEGVGEMPCVETPRSAQSPPRPRRERSIRRGFRRVYTGSRVPVTLSSSTVIVSLNGVHSINFAFGCAYTCTRVFRSASCLFSFERSNRDWYESDPGLGRVQWSLERVISITWTAVHSGRVGGAVESAGESAHPAESGFLWRRSEGSQDSSPPGNARKSRSFYLHRYVQPPIPRQPRQPVSRQQNGSLVNRPLSWIVLCCAPFNHSSVVVVVVVVYAHFTPATSLRERRRSFLLFFVFFLFWKKSCFVLEGYKEEKEVEWE